MQKYVLDNSVLLKFVLSEEEENKDKALELLEEYRNNKADFIMPSLWYFEACNVIICKKISNAQDYINTLKKINFRIIDIDLSIQEIAFSICKKYPKISFYDAIYHAIAINGKFTLITADKKYYEKTKNEGSIKLLNNF